MTGAALDARYVAARRVLLDALEALADHRAAVILAGAQAIYVRTGTADLDLSVAPYTLDADLALDPRILGPDPRIDSAMRSAGFHLTPEPGIWSRATTANGETIDVPVDLLVPETLAGAGRRSARLPDHGKNAARRTPGLEAIVADHSEELILSLEPEVDPRAVAVPVAGPAALLVAKAHKLFERHEARRRGGRDRLKPKDASDVFRLMQTQPAEDIGRRLSEIAGDPMAEESVRAGVAHIRALFGKRDAIGVDLAVRALGSAVPEARIRTLAPAYVAVLLDAYEQVEVG